VDIQPTVLAAVGANPPATWHDHPVPTAPGKSLLPVLVRDGAVSHETFWWLHEGNRALRVGNWKIVAAGKDSPWELYDLTVDRSESRNLAAEQPEKTQEMAARWQKETDRYFELARKDLPSRK
jgi:arylsulfatase